MSKKRIAVIYEGERTEKRLVNNISQCFFSQFTELLPIMFPAGENIYMLWKQLEEDDFQTDLIEVLREYNQTARETLRGYTRRDFSEIYLFFDYDGHTNNLAEGLNEVALLEMLSTFSDETDLGKLYINYPMVESLRDNRTEDCCFRRCSVPLDQIAHYKRIVDDIKEFQNFGRYGKKEWKTLCRNTIRKWNCIINMKYEIPDRTVFLGQMEQKKLFARQRDCFISQNRLAVINSFPLFLLEYFKPEFWRQMLYE